MFPQRKDGDGNVKPNGGWGRWTPTNGNTDGGLRGRQGLLSSGSTAATTRGRAANQLPGPFAFPAGPEPLSRTHRFAHGLRSSSVR